MSASQCSIIPSPSSVSVWDLLREGDVEAVTQTLSEHGVAPEEVILTKTDRQGNSYMHIAALFGQSVMLEHLIDLVEAAHNPYYSIRTYAPRDNSDLTPLHFAASEGHLECVKILIRKTAIPVKAVSKDIDVRLSGIPLYLSGGKTALHLAAEKGNLDVVKFLVEEIGVQSDLKDFDGSTPALLALANNQVEVAKYLDPSVVELSKAERQRLKEELFKKCRERVLAKKDETADVVASKYTPLHPSLYKQGSFLDDLEEPLRALVSKLDKKEMDFEQFRADIRVLHSELVPGSRIFTFKMFTDSACAKWYSELQNYEEKAKTLGLPLRRPNSMNNYGIVLNDIGLGLRIAEFVEKVVTPLSSVFLPDYLGSEGKFQSHHSFSVQYRLGEDLDLATHVDASDVTLNICLGKEFEGASLYFHKLKGGDDDKEQGDSPYQRHPTSGVCEHCICSWEHKPGIALLHPGNRIHGVNQLISGERGNLIIWCRKGI